MKTPRKTKQAAYRRGLVAELLAIIWLTLKGYRLLAWRYQSPVGEIDLVFRRQRTLVFCEVKHRKTLEDAVFSLQKQQQRRIMRAAEHFIHFHPRLAGLDMAFDAVFISTRGLKHLRHAWQQE
ncbi:MAG: YraN family protein [Holosporales bacterium]